MTFGYSKDLIQLYEWQAALKKEGKQPISEKNIRVAFFPQMEKVGSKKVIGKVSALAVPKSSENASLAWRFLKFASRKENLLDFFKETKLPTPRLDLLQEQSDDPQVGIFVMQSKFSQANVFPVSKETFKVALAQLVLRINERKISVERGLEYLGNQMSDDLKSYWLRENELSK